MLKYTLSRIGYMLVTFFVIAAMTFMMMQLLPGSPFNSEKLTDEQIEILKKAYDLDEPVPQRFVKYMVGLVQGDLGVSFALDGRPVSQIISNRIGPSATIGGEAIVFGTILGLLLGIIAALKRNTIIDYSAMVIAVLGISVPAFVLGALLQYYFAVKWRLFPVTFHDSIEGHILPVFSLAVLVIATVARFMRTEMLDVLGQDYIMTATAKGLSRVQVIFKHTVRNALIPVVTIIGPLIVALMTGSLVIEAIFAVPGLGSEFVDSISKRDYPMIMGVTLFYSMLFISSILVVDLMYGVIDPRIRLAGGDDK
ncbi:MAG TPA: ABC transporter permease [Bacillales bacterium]|nr:ABC transporter permease [Bacillales bacterium]